MHWMKNNILYHIMYKMKKQIKRMIHLSNFDMRLSRQKMNKSLESKVNMKSMH